MIFFKQKFIKDIKKDIDLLEKDSAVMLQAIKDGAYKGKQLRRTTWQVYIYGQMIASAGYYLAKLGDFGVVKKYPEYFSGDYKKGFDYFDKVMKKLYAKRD